MPQFHGRNANLTAWDTSNTCRLVSGDLNQITLSWTRDNPETTTMGKDSIQRMAGLRDAALNAAAIYNTESASGLTAWAEPIMAGSLLTLLRFAPAGSSASAKAYTGCFTLNQYEVSAPVNGPVTATFAFQLAAGSLTSTCIEP